MELVGVADNENGVVFLQLRNANVYTIALDVYKATINVIMCADINHDDWQYFISILSEELLISQY